MPRFLLSVHSPASAPSEWPMTDEQRRKMMQGIEQLEARMRAADALVSSVRLADAGDAVVVDAGASGDGPVVTDGPFLETKELIAGFYVVEAESSDAAIGWATETSKAVGMPIEIRAFLDYRDG